MFGNSEGNSKKWGNGRNGNGDAPVGKLILIGGREDKGSEHEGNFKPAGNLEFFKPEILSRFIDEIQEVREHVEVITTASSIPEEIGNLYKESFKRLDVDRIELMHIRSREEANHPDIIRRLETADGIMFTGGNQMRLSSTLGGTQLHELLQYRYKNDHIVIAGTSAGAMAMSNTMIYTGSPSEALLKGSVKITTGLGLIQDVIIDTHFVKRGRFGRLAQAVVGNPSCIGIGLGENTAVLVTNGDNLETLGTGLVILVDGHNIKYTNISDIEEGTPLSIQNLTVHVLSKGDRYILREGKFIPGEIKREETSEDSD
ncbi:MAG: cyanophycinase [Bacteroidetes bacterium]|nr:cyanophycinase [Bacteroidota bacterium]